ncbi:MAG: trypsin-like peptidase domain-containing protein [Chloroflexota bacterium]
MRRAQYLGTVLLILSLLVACAPASQPTTAPTNPPVELPTSAPQPTPTQQADVLSLLRSATVQIEAQGSFVDPELGSLYNVAGRGTGFIIDPSGIAVTNNHVVTGAALLKVFLAGETRPRNAKILGVSECWDLAVIDIEGDDFPFLTFYEGEITPGLEVYAAGFPLGDPEYTLTKGIVSKANADGESFWASVPAVIEHDARIRGGNSGGPLVNMQGQVVGVNYAGNDRFDQNFAIRGKDAWRVIEILRSGQDYESIGINGQAVVSEDGSLSGIWVASVKSGSPAGKAGLQGGDIITLMEGLVLATDGQMTDYCNILRTRNASDVLAIEVLRFSTQEVLAGELNGKPLETKFSFAQELSEDVSGGSGQAYGDYVQVQDDYGAIQIAIPSTWTQVDGSPWVSDGEIIGAAITAAANLDRFNNAFDEPGVFFGVSDEVAKLAGYIQLLDYYKSVFQSSCKWQFREKYEDNAFEGSYDVYKNCDNAGNLFVVLTARPKVNKTSLLVSILFNAMTDADLEVFDQILATFDVVGTLP